MLGVGMKVDGKTQKESFMEISQVGMLEVHGESRGHVLISSDL